MFWLHGRESHSQSTALRIKCLSSAVIIAATEKRNLERRRWQHNLTRGEAKQVGRGGI